MKLYQSIFVVFYAVFFSTMLSSGTGLRCFQWGWICCEKQALRRFLLSVFLMNFCPVAYFTLIYIRIDKLCIGTISFAKIFALFLLSLSVFLFYRIYHLIIATEKVPSFWYSKRELELPDIKDRLSNMGPAPKGCLGQFLAVLFYILMAIIGYQLLFKI